MTTHQAFPPSPSSCLIKESCQSLKLECFRKEHLPRDPKPTGNSHPWVVIHHRFIKQPSPSRRSHVAPTSLPHRPRYTHPSTHSSTHPSHHLSLIISLPAIRLHVVSSPAIARHLSVCSIVAHNSPRFQSLPISHPEPPFYSAMSCTSNCFFVDQAVDQAVDQTFYRAIDHEAPSSTGQT